MTINPLHRAHDFTYDDSTDEIVAPGKIFPEKQWQAAHDSQAKAKKNDVEDDRFILASQVKFPEIRLGHPDDLIKAKKNDTGKLDYTLLPLSGLESVVQALEFGAKKYGAFNYKAKGFTTRRLCAATIRHVFAYLKGEDDDPESGLSHLAHAGASILMLLEKIQDKSLDADDRYSKGA